MSKEIINNNGLEDEALQELLDSFYEDCGRINLLKFGLWKAAEEEIKPRKNNPDK